MIDSKVQLTLVFLIMTGGRVEHHHGQDGVVVEVHVLTALYEHRESVCYFFQSPLLEQSFQPGLIVIVNEILIHTRTVDEEVNDGVVLVTLTCNGSKRLFHEGLHGNEIVFLLLRRSSAMRRDFFSFSPETEGVPMSPELLELLYVSEIEFPLGFGEVVT